MESYELISVTPGNVAKTGFFCYMSKPKSPGYQQKHRWLDERFTEGLQIKILHETGGRDTGFIEYIPGEYAWRAVHAPGYLFVHCLWVVGKGKGKGYGSRLLEACLDDARRQGKLGVAMIATERVWLAKRDILLRNGFEEVGQAPPCFHLFVHRLQAGPDPYFPTDWEERQSRFGAGVTVLRTPQCPYVEDAAAFVLSAAVARGLPARQISLESASQVRELSPSPYGVFGIVYNGRLLSYYYLPEKELNARLDQMGSGEWRN